MYDEANKCPYQPPPPFSAVNLWYGNGYQITKHTVRVKNVEVKHGKSELI